MQLAWSVREGAAAWFQVVGGRFVAQMPGQAGDP
jgi:hypothetical protein